MIRDDIDTGFLWWCHSTVKCWQSAAAYEWKWKETKTKVSPTPLLAPLCVCVRAPWTTVTAEGDLRSRPPPHRPNPNTHTHKSVCTVSIGTACDHWNTSFWSLGRKQPAHFYTSLQRLISTHCPCSQTSLNFFYKKSLHSHLPANSTDGPRHQPAQNEPIQQKKPLHYYFNIYTCFNL